MKNGLDIRKPTSVDVASGSSSISTKGLVTFSGASSVSLNGVFSSAYDSYLIHLNFRHTNTPSGDNARIRFRASGTDATSSNYSYQELYVSGTTVILNGYGTSNSGFLFYNNSSTTHSGFSLFVGGPFLAQQTAYRSLGSAWMSQGIIQDTAVVHGISSSYDGFTIFQAFGSALTGNVTVYGFVQ